MSTPPTPDPRIAENIIATGELALRRRAREPHAREQIELAVRWLLDVVRRELRHGGPGA